MKLNLDFTEGDRETTSNKTVAQESQHKLPEGSVSTLAVKAAVTGSIPVPSIDLPDQTPSQNAAMRDAIKDIETNRANPPKERWHLIIEIPRYGGKMYPPTLKSAWLEGFAPAARKEKKAAEAPKVEVAAEESY